MNEVSVPIANPKAEPDDAGILNLLQAARVLQSRLETALDSVGLSVTKYQALEELVRADGPVSLRALADCQKCVRSNITQLVDRLEADGLVKRADDPNDRRGVRAVITPLGKERYTAAYKAIRDVQTDLTSEMSETDRAHFRRILSSFRDE